MRVSRPRIAGVQVGEQRADELVAQVAPAGGQRGDLGTRVGTAGHDRERELQPERPALGHLLQAGGRVDVDVGAEPAAHERDRLAELEAQLRRTDHDAVPVVDQFLDAQRAVGARGDDDAQVGGRVAQQVHEHVERLGGQAIDLVGDEHDVQRRLRHLGEPGRDAFDRVAGRPGQQRVAEGGPARADAHRERQRLHETSGIVLRLRRKPRDDSPARQALAPPLRQQRGLPVAGRCLHDRDGLLQQARVAGQQPLARHQMARHAGRGDLEQQVAGADRGH
jgi:hypothetical protein